MIEGLRLMPRAHAYAEEQEEDGDPYARVYGNCTECLEHFTRHQRAGMHCGYLPERERYGRPLQPVCSVEASVCYGYSTSLPEVQEAHRALSWRKDGALAEYLGGRMPTPVLRDAMDILSSAIAETQGEVRRRLKEQHEERRRGAERH